MITYKEIEELENYNRENIPNGGIYFEILTSYIFSKCFINKSNVLQDYFIKQVKDKINEITRDIKDNKFRSLYKYVEVIPDDEMILDGEILHIKLKWLINLGDTVSLYTGWLKIPLINKPLAVYREETLIQKNVDELTKEIDKQILEEILKEYEFTRVKEDRRSSKWKNYNFKGARKFNGTNSKIKRTSSSCSCNNK